LASRADYTEWSKEDLIKKIKTLEKRKKYGLVWDSVREPEKVVLDCQNELPVLKEIKDKEIHSSKDDVTHILIEGDNYHALSVLNYTHEKAVDLIYIDPPYNTGNDDFIYNDRYIDRENPYRHTKWLSFMDKRLRLAKSLLKTSGIVFISIDDNELAHLKLLCDDIWGENNFVAILPTIMNLKGNQDQFGFAGTHEYTMVYARDATQAKFGLFQLDDEGLEDWQQDDTGLFRKGANLKATGVNAPRSKRPNLFFPIFFSNDGDFYVTEDDKAKSKKDITVLPMTDSKEMSWRWSKNKIRNEKHNLIIEKNNGTITVYKKQRPALGELPSRKPKTVFYRPEYSSGNGTAQLKELFGEKIFNNPKPIDLIKDFIILATQRDGIVLDFTAGSGTTGHAVLALNQEDGGNRQFILCTNNENNICTDVCYPRIQKVMKGYENPKGEGIEGLGSNLKYYITEFVPAAPTDKNKEQLTRQSIEMLTLKEGTFEKVTESPSYVIYRNSAKYTGIIFDQLSFAEFKKAVAKVNKPISLYIFSLADEDFSDDFADMKGLVKISAIPESILRVYRRIFR